MSEMVGRMMERMAGRMPQEQMQGMMQGMMAHMFDAMTLDDRIRFMQSMMAVCLPRFTEGMNPATRATLLQEMAHLLAAKPDGGDGAAV